jgi:hypothetical protein
MMQLKKIIGANCQKTKKLILVMMMRIQKIDLLKLTIYKVGTGQKKPGQKPPIMK